MRSLHLLLCILISANEEGVGWECKRNIWIKSGQILDGYYGRAALLLYCKLKQTAMDNNSVFDGNKYLNRNVHVLSVHSELWLIKSQNYGNVFINTIHILVERLS